MEGGKVVVDGLLFLEAWRSDPGGCRFRSRNFPLHVTDESVTCLIKSRPSLNATVKSTSQTKYPTRRRNILVAAQCLRKRRARATEMSSLRGGRGTSRGRGNSTSAPPKGPAAAANNQTRTPRAGFNGYNARGRGNNQLVLNGSTRGGPNTRATGSRGSSASRARGGNMNTSQAAATTSKKDGLGGMPTGGNAASYQDRFQAVRWSISQPSEREGVI